LKHSLRYAHSILHDAVPQWRNGIQQLRCLLTWRILQAPAEAQTLTTKRASWLRTAARHHCLPQK
jgi:hypothetical protein